MIMRRSDPGLFESRSVNLENYMELWQWYYQSPEDNWIEATWAELNQFIQEGTITADTHVTWQGFGYSIPFRWTDAKFFYLYRGSAVVAYTEDELHAAAEEGRITPSTKIWGQMLPAEGIQYDALQIIDLNFSPDIKTFISTRISDMTTILSGSNNSGKSLVLKLLRRDLGASTTFLSCNRFYQMDVLSHAAYNDNFYRQRHQQFVAQLYRQRQNIENNDFNLPELLGRMTNTQRDSLWRICSEMLGEEFSLKQVNPENELSQYYVDVGGKSLGVASSGTRLLLMIVAAFLDENCSIFLVDEPEIGLSPRLQAALAKYLINPELRRASFPHVTHIFIATHSHLFLDRKNMTNNFVVSKNGTQVSVKQVQSINQFHDLQFNMLGNDLEALFLPSAIVIVEGDTDYLYLKKIFQLHFADKRISVVLSRGEGDTKDRLNVIKDSLGDLMKSPYRERIFVLLDQKRSVRERDFTKHGIPPSNIVVLDKNGIEYYYPIEILTGVFACGSDPLSQIRIENDLIKASGIEKTKKQLCEEILSKMSISSTLPIELLSKLLEPIRKLVS
jgi:predicted ATPase